MNSGVVKKKIDTTPKIFFEKRQQPHDEATSKGFVFRKKCKRFFFYYFVNGLSNIEKFALNFCDKCLTMSRSLMDVLGLEVS